MLVDDQREYHRNYMREWRLRNPDKQYARPSREEQRDAMRSWRAANRERDQANRRARRARDPLRERVQAHGLTVEQYTAMLVSQHGVCAAEGCDQEATCIDHDHGCCPGRYSCGKCVRGLLCLVCNFHDALA